VAVDGSLFICVLNIIYCTLYFLQSMF
jgi:hypothetical protein